MCVIVKKKICFPVFVLSNIDVDAIISVIPTETETLDFGWMDEINKY